MPTKSGNPCIRCGKERVIKKTWKELVGNSLITYTTTTCPDAKCQEIVEKEIAARDEKKKAIAQKRLQSKENRRKSITLKTSLPVRKSFFPRTSALSLRAHH